MYCLYPAATSHLLIISPAFVLLHRPLLHSGAVVHIFECFHDFPNHVCVETWSWHWHWRMWCKTAPQKAFSGTRILVYSRSSSYTDYPRYCSVWSKTALTEAHVGGKGHETTPSNSVCPLDIMHNSPMHKPVGTHEFLGEDAAGSAQPFFEIYAAAVACLNGLARRAHFASVWRLQNPQQYLDLSKIQVNQLVFFKKGRCSVSLIGIVSCPRSYSGDKIIMSENASELSSAFATYL